MTATVNLPERLVKQFIENAEAPQDAEVKATQKSKFKVEVVVCVGLCQYAKYTLDARTGVAERVN